MATPELLDAQVDMQHRSYVAVVLSGTCSHGDDADRPSLASKGDMVDPDRRPKDKATRFQFDMSLIAALLDRWRPETHTFHFTVAVGAHDVPASWRDELLAHFAGVQRNARAPPYRTFVSTHGPTKRDDADDATVARHFEAYLLWLFGWGDSCLKHLLPVARAIADVPLDDLPQYSWGSAVLAATYRGLCKCVMKVSADEPIFVGCPMLLQLWSYERFPVGRPLINLDPYTDLSADHDEVDMPTMGSLWCLRKTKKSYPDFVGQFDALVDTDVRWTPYSPADVAARAPNGLSSLCLRDQQYWMTRKPVIYDIHIEEYHVHRVMRQFGLHQDFPVPVTHSVPAHGQPPGSLWAAKVLPFVQSWDQALDDLVFENRPHTDEAFSRTRTRMVHVPPEAPMAMASLSDTYPLVRDQNFAAEAASSLAHCSDMTHAQHLSAYRKIADLCVTTPPFHLVVHVRERMELRHGMGCASSGTLCYHDHVTSSSSTHARRLFLLWVHTGPDLHDDDDADENMGQFDNQEWVQQYYGSGQHDVVGPSQLSGAPEDLTPLPEAGRRPGRDIVPPDPLTGTGCGETCQERGAKAEEQERRVRQQQIRLKGKKDELKRRRAELGQREAALKIQEEQFQAREAQFKREAEEQKNRYKEPAQSSTTDERNKKGKFLRFTQ
ncbi:hypothetical protein HU200_009389 [Digitaria exilis]|uniref:Aminotransferase-like plant mobile domain-containing protein n=1 Tax=Digitaria exilis TaxID=1010633 RepID=A0A835FJY3_9POAL|nr:hypothetical protein HU200_009389 [Digitaria exilis]